MQKSDVKADDTTFVVLILISRNLKIALLVSPAVLWSRKDKPLTCWQEHSLCIVDSTGVTARAYLTELQIESHTTVISIAMARLVLNHSTFVNGLKDLLEKVASKSQQISTIIPGRLHKTKTSLGRNLEFKVCVSHGIESRLARSGQRVLARKGQLVQEVYFVLKDIPATERRKNEDEYTTFANHLREVLKNEDCTITVHSKETDIADNDNIMKDMAQRYKKNETKVVLDKVKWW